MRKLFLLFFFIHFISAAQLRHKLDSLLSFAIKYPSSDTVLANTLNEISYELRRVNPDSSKLIAEKALVLSTKLGFKKGIAFANNNLGVFYHVAGDYSKALTYYELAKKIKLSIGDRKGAAATQDNIGITYYLQGYYDKALSYYLSSLKIQEEIHDSAGMASTFNYLASVYLYLVDYEKSLKNYLAAISIHEKLNDEAGLSQEYNNIGIVYSRLGNLDKAIESYKTAISFLSSTGDKYLTASAYNNLGSAMKEKKQYDKSLDYFRKSLQLSKEMNQTRGIAYNLVGIGEVYELKKDFAHALENYLEGYKLHELTKNRRDMANTLVFMAGCYTQTNRDAEAMETYNKALALAKEIKAKDLVSQCYQGFTKLYKQKKDFKRSYDYLLLYAALRDSILNEDKNKSLAEMQTRFDTDKKEKEIALLTKTKDLEELQSSEQQANIKKQRVTIYASLGGITLALTLAFFVLQGYNQKRKANSLLEEKNEAIRKQKQILEEKNIQITDSIEYAKSMQDAILPDPEIFKKPFADSFILFKPKDVVSGDFYWISTSKDEVLVSAIDCVGHGVPGAFMALHSYNLLERIVKEKKDLSPAEILDRLNKNILESLHQENETSSAKHGMDLALIKLKNRSLEFSGARNPLVIVSPNGELTEIKADRMYVGGAQGNFTNSSFTPEPGSMLYIFTDGYADQKGGPQNKKFFAEPLRSLFKEISSLPCEKQRDLLEEKHIAWKGAGEQLDDILIVGIRV